MSTCTLVAAPANDNPPPLDKRLTLEVRVTNIEKKVFGASQDPAHQ
jgi:hypothetical protein